MLKEPFDSTPRKIDGQNRVALPAEVMAALSVKSGDHVIFRVVGKEVRLSKVHWIAER